MPRSCAASRCGPAGAPPPARHRRSRQDLGGLRFQFQSLNGKVTDCIWEVWTDVYNQSYLYDPASKAYSYFINDGTLFYFTGYEGSRDSLLFYFFKACYKILLGFYSGLTLKDQFPADLISSERAMFFQDFSAPFFQFIHAGFEARCESADDLHHPSNIKLITKSVVSSRARILEETQFSIAVRNGRIQTIEVLSRNGKVGTFTIRN